MGKQTKVKKPENLGKGKVTPVQVAFIVDQYLVDNKYTQTSTIFRTEASTLISKTQVRQAPKSLLSLEAILDDYICLKEQKIMLDQEKCRLDQEKCRVETLLQGMKSVMNDYNSSGNISPLSISPMATPPMALIPRSDPTNRSSAVYPMNRTSPMNSAAVPWLSNTTAEPNNFSTPTANISRNKRKGSKLVPDVPPTSKRIRNQIPTNQSPVTGNINPLQAHNPTSTEQRVEPHYPPPKDSSLQGSSVAKSLFKHSPPTCSKTNSPGPNTPPQVLNTDALSVSPLESSSLVNLTDNTSPPQEITPTSCSVISPEKVAVSPSKRFAYYTIERNHYISSSSPIKTPSKRLVKRDHVKGRLDFDASSVPMSLEKPMMADLCPTGPSGEADIFNMDIPNFDAFGADFSLSELLVDIDFGCEGTEPTSDHSSDFVTGSGHEFEDAMLEPNQTLTELSSSVSEVLCEKNMNIEGQDSLASVKSITKCIRILSPAKNRRNPSPDQEKLS